MQIVGLHDLRSDIDKVLGDDWTPITVNTHGIRYMRYAEPQLRFMIFKSLRWIDDIYDGYRVRTDVMKNDDVAYALATIKDVPLEDVPEIAATIIDMAKELEETSHVSVENLGKPAFDAVLCSRIPLSYRRYQEELEFAADIVATQGDEWYLYDNFRDSGDSHVYAAKGFGINVRMCICKVKVKHDYWLSHVRCQYQVLDGNGNWLTLYWCNDVLLREVDELSTEFLRCMRSYLKHAYVAGHHPANECEDFQRWSADRLPREKYRKYFILVE